MFKICNSTFLVSVKYMTRCSNIALYTFLSFAVESESEGAKPSVKFTKFPTVRISKWEQKRLQPSHLVTTGYFKIMYEGKCLISECQGFNYSHSFKAGCYVAEELKYVLLVTYNTNMWSEWKGCSFITLRLVINFLIHFWLFT